MCGCRVAPKEVIFWSWHHHAVVCVLHQQPSKLKQRHTVKDEQTMQPNATFAMDGCQDHEVHES